MPADVLAPNGARPSVGTVMTTNLDIFSSQVSVTNQDLYASTDQMTLFKIVEEIPWHLAALMMLIF